MRPDPHGEFHSIIERLDDIYGVDGWGAGHFRMATEDHWLADDLLKLYRGEEVPDYQPREGESTLDYCARIPKQRWSHEAKGKLLEFPQTGLIGVPYRMNSSSGGWDVVVVRPDEAGTYQPGGYCLAICRQEIETAIEREVA